MSEEIICECLHSLQNPTECTERLSMFLDALDEWGCSSNDERAKEIMKFLSSGADLSNYEEKP